MVFSANCYSSEVECTPLAYVDQDLGLILAGHEAIYCTQLGFNTATDVFGEEYNHSVFCSIDAALQAEKAHAGSLLIGGYNFALEHPIAASIALLNAPQLVGIVSMAYVAFEVGSVAAKAGYAIQKITQAALSPLIIRTS